MSRRYIFRFNCWEVSEFGPINGPSIEIIANDQDTALKEAKSLTNWTGYLDLIEVKEV